MNDFVTGRNFAVLMQFYLQVNLFVRENISSADDFYKENK